MLKLTIGNIYNNQIPEQLKTRTYIVGGFVRDYLIYKDFGHNSDIDFVVENSNHEEMTRLGFKQVGGDFPVYLKDGYEFALCRQERKTGKKYTEFKTKTENVSLKDDLMRRDLTINAIAIDYKGNVIDPFNGIKDIENKILKHTSKTFKEDPLRVLRVARFKTKYKNFVIDQATKNIISEIKQELKYLTPERIFKELEKILELNNTSEYFRVLNDLDILDIIYPELYIMKGCKQNPMHHAEGDVFEHSLRVLDEACKLSSKKEVRFAALFHDIAKPVCRDGLKYHGHDNPELTKEIFTKFQKRIKVPNRYIKFAILSAKLHHKFHKIEEITPKGLTRLFFHKDFKIIKNENDFLDLVNVFISDQQGRITSKNGRTLTKEESDFVFKNGNKVIDHILYTQGQNAINIKYVLKLYSVLKIKSNISQIIKEKKMSTIQIQQYIHKERIDNFKKIKEQHDI